MMGYAACRARFAGCSAGGGSGVIGSFIPAPLQRGEPPASAGESAFPLLGSGCSAARSRSGEPSLPGVLRPSPNEGLSLVMEPDPGSTTTAALLRGVWPGGDAVDLPQLATAAALPASPPRPGGVMPEKGCPRCPRCRRSRG